MSYKIIALRDVTVRAYVRTQAIKRLGTDVITHPSERQEWIALKAGETRTGLGLVVGIHPSCRPDEIPTHVNGVAMIIGDGWLDGDLPKEFYGLFRLDVER